jgi:hypothetical protein
VLVHGAYTAQRALEAGVLDELQIHQILVLFGGGRRLFELLPSRVELEVVRVIDASEATHIRYRVRAEPVAALVGWRSRAFGAGNGPTRSGRLRHGHQPAEGRPHHAAVGAHPEAGAPGRRAWTVASWSPHRSDIVIHDLDRAGPRADPKLC